MTVLASYHLARTCGRPSVMSRRCPNQFVADSCGPTGCSVEPNSNICLSPTYREYFTPGTLGCSSAVRITDGVYEVPLTMLLNLNSTGTPSGWCLPTSLIGSGQYLLEYYRDEVHYPYPATTGWAWFEPSPRGNICCDGGSSGNITCFATAIFLTCDIVHGWTLTIYGGSTSGILNCEAADVGAGWVIEIHTPALPTVDVDVFSGESIDFPATDVFAESAYPGGGQCFGVVTPIVTAVLPP